MQSDTPLPSSRLAVAAAIRLGFVEDTAPDDLRDDMPPENAAITMEQLITCGHIDQSAAQLLVDLVDLLVRSESVPSKRAVRTLGDTPVRRESGRDERDAANATTAAPEADDDSISGLSFLTRKPSGHSINDESLTPDTPDDIRSVLTESRFTVRHSLATGGLGEVFVAHDEQIGRDVALKRMHRRAEQSGVARLRFRRESSVTGRLEHPGIVPVYGRGVDESGRAYYAMKLIRGESLAAAIAARQEKNKGRYEYDDELRSLLRRFIDVCNAIEYAHSRGVLHRDLKPQNIMLGPFGETLVVDWGLAHIRASEGSGRSESVAGEAFGDQIELEASESNATVEGTVMGTAAYMSPEQTRGEISTLTAAADVFSLGATLFEILTGERPKPRRAALQAVPLKPQSAEVRIPVLLASIVTRATQPDPSGRYSSARQLANDVERWMADQPVSSMPDPASVRVARWVRHHRTLASSTALLLLATSVFSIIFSTVTLAKNREINRNRELAVDQYYQARGAVDELVTTATDDAFSRPGFAVLQRSLLSRALVYYDAFLKTDIPVDDRVLVPDRARTLYQKGLIETRIATLADAEHSFRSAIEEWNSLAPQLLSAAQRTQLADTHNQLGTVYARAHQPDKAVAALRMALSLREEVTDQTELDVAEVVALSRMRTNLAQALWFVDREQAAVENKRVVADLSQLARRAQENSDVRRSLAKAEVNQAAFLMETSQFDAAIPHLAVAEESIAWLREHDVDIHDDRLLLAKVYGSRMLALRYPEQNAEALTAGANGLVILRAVLDSEPLAHDVRIDVARTLHNLAVVEEQEGHAEIAVRHWSAARQECHRVLSADPLRENVNVVLADIDYLHALHIAAAGDPDDGIKRLQGLTDRMQKEIDDRSDGHSLLPQLSDVLTSTGDLLLKDQPSAALEYFRRSVKAQSSYLERDPRNEFQRQRLSDGLWKLAAHLRDQGLVEESIELTEERLQRWSMRPEEMFYSAWEYAQAAHLCLALDEAGLAASYRKRALDLLERAVDAGFRELKTYADQPGLKNLADDPRFVEVLKRAAE